MKPIEINPDHRRSPLRGLSGAVLVADDHDIVRFELSAKLSIRDR